MCVFLAVCATDVILLDIFNTLGMPTSTTVSMVFGLIGGSTALAFKYIINDGLRYSELINTDKALTVIRYLLIGCYCFCLWISGDVVNSCYFYF